jgi:hypothetical protein
VGGNVRKELNPVPFHSPGAGTHGAGDHSCGGWFINWLKAASKFYEMAERYENMNGSMMGLFLQSSRNCGKPSRYQVTSKEPAGGYCSLTFMMLVLGEAGLLLKWNGAAFWTACSYGTKLGKRK